jgi:hypothetical protein
MTVDSSRPTYVNTLLERAQRSLRQSLKNLGSERSGTPVYRCPLTPELFHEELAVLGLSGKRYTPEEYAQALGRYLGISIMIPRTREVGGGATPARMECPEDAGRPQGCRGGRGCGPQPTRRERRSVRSPLLVPGRGRTFGPPLAPALPTAWLGAGGRTPVLHDLGVAAKLEYTRNRWLDEMVNARDPSPVPLAAHRLNDAVISLIHARYERVLGGPIVASFYKILSSLHARHGLSVILDGRRVGFPERAMSLKEYVEHARVRHGPMRAPLDALLLLVGASERTIRLARASWQNWELGVQFYDDALDVEEDFENHNSSWAVRARSRYSATGSTGGIGRCCLVPTSSTSWR